MPQRDITKEVRESRLRESEIARELRAAREDFAEAERQYRSLEREYRMMEDIHLKKVRRGEMETDQETERLSRTGNDLETFRKSLNEKERLLLIARSAEYNYRHHQYEMRKYMSRNPFSRFIEWVRSFPARTLDRIMDTFAVSAEVKRLVNLPEDERQEEIRKIRASYALDQAERKMERAATTQAKEFILDHPDVGIRNFHEMDVRQQDMIALEKLIGLSARTGETLYLGLGRADILKIEMMDDEMNRGSGYVSVRVMEAGRDSDGQAVLKEGKEIGHVHVEMKRGVWEIDMQSNSKTQMEAFLASGREEVSQMSGIPASGLRKLGREEAEIISEATLDDAARKREALNRAYGKPEMGKNSQENRNAEKEPEKGVDTQEREVQEDKGEKQLNPKKDVIQESRQGTDTDRAEGQDEPEIPVNSEQEGCRATQFTPEQAKARKETEKNIEKALKDLHKGYKKDKTLENHKHPVTVTVDRYQVSINPPNAHNETPYYKVDGRYAGKYMQSNSNPRITMEYIRNHNLLDNPVNTISAEKLDDLQLAGNISRGLLFDINHHSSDVPGYLSGLEASGRNVDMGMVSRFMSSDIRKYPEAEAAQTVAEMYKRIQVYDMDDRHREGPTASLYLDAYKSYMHSEELSHPGKFSSSEVDYVAHDGTLFDKDGKLFLAGDDHVTLDNCEAFCPEEEKETIRSVLNDKRLSDLGIAVQEEKVEGAVENDWLGQDEEVPFDDSMGFNLGDGEVQWMPDEKDYEGPDFALQAELDLDGYTDYDTEQR